MKKNKINLNLNKLSHISRKHFRIQAGAGFSLIELLVGMAIIITSTTIILTIIVSSFRISSKATVVDSARQNGNYAMNRMIRMIQFADRYNGRSRALGATAGIKGSDGGPDWHTDCADNDNTAININYEGEEKIIQCRNRNSIYIVDPVPAPPSGEILIITDKIKVAECNITCSQISDTASPVISIKYKLTIGDSDSVVERKTSSIPFFTSVKMRNK